MTRHFTRDRTAVLAGLLVPLAVAAILLPWRASWSNTNMALLLVVAVVAVAVLGSRAAGALAAVSAFAWFDFFFTRPYGSFTIRGSADITTAVLLLVVGLTAGGTAAFYTFTTYMQTFVKLSVGLTEDQTTFVIFGTLIFATLLQPLYGALSDRIGRKPLLIFFGIAGTLSTVPILTALKETKSPFTAFLLICAAWIFVAGYTSINAIVKAELFPTNVRALGVGLPYAITVSVFGGTAPAIALYFKSLGHEDWFYYYLSGMICLSLIIYSTMRDTKHDSAMHRHE